MYCNHCGREVTPEQDFCPECGAALRVKSTAPEPNAGVTPDNQTVVNSMQNVQAPYTGGYQGNQGGPQYRQPNGPAYSKQEFEQSLPEEYRPVSMWAFLGYTILFSIPVVGWICAIVFAFASSKINVRNYARGYLIFLIIGIVIWIIVCVALIVLGVSLSSYGDGWNSYPIQDMPGSTL